MSISGSKKLEKKSASKDEKKPSSKSSKSKIIGVNRSQARNLFLASVVKGDPSKVAYWLDKFYSDVSSKIKEAFKLAVEHGHHHLLRLLYDCQRKHFEDRDPDTLEIMPVMPSDKTFFRVRQDKHGQAFKVLTKKGMAFFLDHSYKDKKILYVSGSDYVANPIDLFIKSREAELNIVFDLGGFSLHRLIIKCEREGSKIHITKIDSTPENEQAIKDFDGIVNIYEAEKKEEEFTYNSNTTYQQNLAIICGTFSAVNLGLAKYPFFQQIKPFCVNDNDHTVASYDYLLPPDFMHLAGSYRLIRKYMSEMLIRLQAFDPADVAYKTNIHRLDQLLSQAFQPREMKEAGITSPVVIENEDFIDEEPEFIIKSIADVMPEDPEADLDSLGDRALVVTYDNLDDFLQKNRGEQLTQRFLDYMNSFPLIYKNRTAEIYAEEHALLFKDKQFSLKQIDETAMRYDAMLYEVSSSGDIVLCQQRCEERQKRQKQRFALVRDMALQSWVLSDESRHKQFLHGLRKQFPLLKKINPSLFITEELVLAIFKEEGLAAAYVPYPVDFFRTHLSPKAAVMSASAMDVGFDKKAEVPDEKVSQSKTPGLFSQAKGKRKSDALGVEAKDANPAELKKAKADASTISEVVNRAVL